MSIQTGRCKVVANPTKTENLFGPISEVAGKTLEVIERNESGDCLSIFTGAAGLNLVDVDHVDVEKFEPEPLNGWDALMGLVGAARRGSGARK